jgi:hypothetical protein
VIIWVGIVLGFKIYENCRLFATGGFLWFCITFAAMKNLLKGYQEKADYFDALAQKAAGRATVLSWSRLIAFILAIILSWWLFNIDPNWMAVGLLLILPGFFFLIRMHLKAESERDRFKTLAGIQRKEIEALNWQWKEWDPGIPKPDPTHDFSFDLDIFGKGSLFQYLNRTVTRSGTDLLSDWFSNPTRKSEEILSRQGAVAELSAMNDYREAFLAEGLLQSESENSMGAVLEWLNGPVYYVNRKLIPIMLIVLPGICLSLLIAWMIGQLPVHMFLFSAILNLAFVGSQLKKVNPVHVKITKTFPFLNKYAGLLLLSDKIAFSSPYLQTLAGRFSSEDSNAGKGLEKLGSLFQSLDQRLNMVAGLLLNAFLIWDIQCVWRMEKWREQYRTTVPDWFDALSRIDALISLATFKANRPELCFPEPVDSLPILEATELGHPLLHPEKRVDNDFVMDSESSFRILTGANMAGKSTFLRTVGVNLILAMSGGPVCAKAFRFRPVQLMTSVRMTDSLADDESYFFAELKRLKRIVDALEKGERLFIIIDEMLKGTNSRDKEAGSKGLLTRLVKLGGTGIVATHDLSLGIMADHFPGKVENLCFEVEIEDDGLHFDYKLRKGISQNLNATYLMQQMGIVESGNSTT